LDPAIRLRAGAQSCHRRPTNAMTTRVISLRQRFHRCFSPGLRWDLLATGAFGAGEKVRACDPLRGGDAVVKFVTLCSRSWGTRLSVTELSSCPAFMQLAISYSESEPRVHCLERFRLRRSRAHGAQGSTQNCASAFKLVGCTLPPPLICACMGDLRSCDGAKVGLLSKTMLHLLAAEVAQALAGVASVSDQSGAYTRLRLQGSAVRAGAAARVVH